MASIAMLKYRGVYLKKLMLEGVPHQVAKVVSISTNPQKAKTCHGVTSHVGPRFEKTRLSTMSGIKLTHIKFRCFIFVGRIPGFVCYCSPHLEQRSQLVPFLAVKVLSRRTMI